jgi:hypothetical protein
MPKRHRKGQNKPKIENWTKRQKIKIKNQESKNKIKIKKKKVEKNI